MMTGKTDFGRLVTFKSEIYVTMQFEVCKSCVSNTMTFIFLVNNYESYLVCNAHKPSETESYVTV